jgi:hypothetical protein
MDVYDDYDTDDIKKKTIDIELRVKVLLKTSRLPSYMDHCWGGQKKRYKMM